MIWLGVLLSALVLGGILIWSWTRIAVPVSRFAPSEADARFPVVSGSNLMREEFEFPRDFEGEYNLLIIPFQQIQQRDVNTWLPAAQELERRFPGLIYYELPTIYRLPTISRTFINEGMRAGIPDQTSRERTITFYLDKTQFKQSLAINTEQTIHLFLVDRQGAILWREEGVFDQDKVQSLIDKLEELI